MYLEYKPGSRIFSWTSYFWWWICYLQPPPEGELVRQEILKIIFRRRLVTRTAICLNQK